MANYLHQDDLPETVTFSGSVAVDSETMGLLTPRDRLCVVQLSAGDGDAHLVQFQSDPRDKDTAPRLKALLQDASVEKIFHFARFDVAAFAHWLGVSTTPIYCTKIASRLVRTYTDRHGLKDLVRELIGAEISKQQQSSDWGGETLSEAQVDYAASDVLHLHALRERLDVMLAREGRTHLARACFDFLPTRAALDNAGWADTDIFAHS
ncbi:MAG: ribonuclease D [Pseudomonadota bacterium]